MTPITPSRTRFLGASAAVIESVAKLVAAGCDFENRLLTFQEYFERLGKDPKRFGKPLSALLGAYAAQEELCLGAIGGKDSMSGSFDDMDVPPTLVSFAIAPQDAARLISPEFKAADHPVYFFDAPYNQDGSPDYQTMKHIWNEVCKPHCLRQGCVRVGAVHWRHRRGRVQDGAWQQDRLAFDESFPTEAL